MEQPISATTSSGLRFFPTSSTPSKASVWPKPNYRRLIDDGHHPNAIRIFKFLWDWLPSKPLSSLPNSNLHYSNAVAKFSAAAEHWLHSSPQCRLSQADFRHVLSRVLGSVWGHSSTDVTYATARWERSDRGCELHVVLGKKNPFSSLPKPNQVEKIHREMAFGWPSPRPVYQTKSFFVVPSSDIQLECVAGTSRARWPHSSSSDKGHLAVFSDGNEASDWFDALPAFLVISDKPGTRIVSSHDTLASATSAAYASAGLPVPRLLRAKPQDVQQNRLVDVAVVHE